MLRKRNDRLKLRVVVGFVCVLGGGIVVLMVVLWREVWRGDGWPTSQGSPASKAGTPTSEWPHHKARDVPYSLSH